jgi:hypothetical protein
MHADIENIKITDDPIFIVGPHKSGTSLIRNLLDGHPDLFVIPIEMHFLMHSGLYIEYPYRKSEYNPVTINAFNEKILQWVKQSEAKTDRYADSITTGKWDIDLLAQLLNNTRTKRANLREMLDYVVKALYLALNFDPQARSIRFVEKSVENAELVPIYKKIYPNAHFIHTVRNPYANLVSFRKYKTKQGKYPKIKPIVQSLLTNYKSLFRNMVYLDDINIIRYEDLATAPKETMKSLAGRVGIGYDQSLEKPTSLARSWNGNSTSNESFSSVTSRTIDNWKSDITDFEVWIVNSLMTTMLHEFKYTKILPEKSWLNKPSIENLSTYITNRLYFGMCGDSALRRSAGKTIAISPGIE